MEEEKDPQIENPGEISIPDLKNMKLIETEMCLEMES